MWVCGFVYNISVYIYLYLFMYISSSLVLKRYQNSHKIWMKIDFVLFCFVLKISSFCNIFVVVVVVVVAIFISIISDRSRYKQTWKEESLPTKNAFIQLNSALILNVYNIQRCPITIKKNDARLFHKSVRISFSFYSFWITTNMSLVKWRRWKTLK